MYFLTLSCLILSLTGWTMYRYGPMLDPGTEPGAQETIVSRAGAPAFPGELVDPE